MPRHTRRVNVSPVPTRKMVYLDKAERAKIEAAYGYELSEELWDEILDLTSEVATYEPTVNSAASLAATLKKLDELGIAVRSLLDDIDKKRPDPGVLNLKEIWSTYFHALKKPSDHDDYFLFLIRILRPIMAMCELAARSAKSNATLGWLEGPHEGSHWNVWIYSLTFILERHGFPTAARKDTDKQKDNMPSPFVLLISELQKYLPKEGQRFIHSKEALADGIYRARKACKDEMSESRRIAEAKTLFVECFQLYEQGRLAEDRHWRRRDVKELFRARCEEDEELIIASNEVVDFVRAGELDKADKAASELLERFPEAHDGYDRLGMVHEGRGENREAAGCYRRVIEIIRRRPNGCDLGFEDVFVKLVDQLDPPGST
jgi:tetratricopeptide (TPR) repeat protein